MIKYYFLCIFIFVSCAHHSEKGYDGFGADSIDKKTLNEFSPKKKDPKLLAQIQGILDIRSMAGGIISNDGKKLYASWSVTGTNQTWKVPGPLQFPIQMTSGEDGSYIGGITPDDNYLIISRDSGGDEMPGLYLQSTKGGPLVEIFRKKKTQTFLNHISSDSKEIYFRANDKDPRTYNLYRYNIKTKKITEVFNGQPLGYWVMLDYLEDEKIYIMSRWFSNTHSEIYFYRENDKKLIPILGTEEKQYYDVAFANESELIVKTNKFSEFHSLYRYNLKSKKYLPLIENKKGDISNFRIDGPRKKIVYSYNIGGYLKIGAISLTNYKKMSFNMIRSKKLLQSYIGSLSANGRYMSIKAVMTDSPGTTYVYDWDNKTMRKWTRPSIPEANINKLPLPRLEYYPARDGTKIPMFVSRPPQCEVKVCPVIVDFHGGPEAQSIPWFRPLNKLYFDRDIILVEPNVRGSRGYGKTWMNADNGAKRLDVLSDIEDIAIFIKKNWAKNGVVPKIAAMGGSYGGYSTFAAMTIYAGAFDIGIPIVGMSDLVSFLKNTAPFRRKLREAEYGYLDKDMEALKKLSPINYLDNIKGPLLIIHGANDPRVPAGEAIQIIRKMQDKGLAGELLLFPDEGHGVRKRKNRAIYFAYILEFLDKHLIEN